MINYDKIKQQVNNALVNGKKALVDIGEPELYGYIEKDLELLLVSIENNDYDKAIDISHRIGQMAIHRVDLYNVEYSNELCDISVGVRRLMNDKDN